MGDAVALEGVEHQLGIERGDDGVGVALDPMRHSEPHGGQMEHRRGVQTVPSGVASPAACSARAELHRLAWLSITPLGKPVVPPV